MSRDNRRRRVKRAPSPPAECFVICHRCDAVRSSHNVRVIEVEALGALVKATVCKEACEPIETREDNEP